MAAPKRPLPGAKLNDNAKRVKTEAMEILAGKKGVKKQLKKVEEVEQVSEDSSDFSDSDSDLGEGSSLSAISGDEGGAGADEIVAGATVNGGKKENGAVKRNENGNGPIDGKPSSLASSLTWNTNAVSGVNGSTSKESHAKQKALAQERKAAKPNADLIARSKRIWERLRRTRDVPREERRKLVAELMEIIKGKVNDFVFKHDSVRIIQTAIKYGKMDQRKVIAKELKGRYKDLAESRYAKFLVGKLLVRGDDEVRDLIIPEFYGHVKRLMRHPEASWILDDIYRTAATPEQKATLLREWYGPEFALFAAGAEEKPPAELSTILEKHPEKRGPIMKHLHDFTNQLVQKKTTGFTMLHDAMLQYFLNCKPGSAEFNESIQVLLDDEEGDCLKNLAFTKSGSRLVCLALAHASAKDRKLILRHYKNTVKLLANDQYGQLVLLTAFEVIDDTVMTGKAIFPELLCKDMGEESRQQELLVQATHLAGRIPLLHLFNPADSQPKWLLNPASKDNPTFAEIYTIRQNTSKKEPETRRKELVKQLAPPLLDLISSQSGALLEATTGTQFTSEILLNTPTIPDTNPTPALSAIISLVTTNDPKLDSVEEFSTHLLSLPSTGRLLKSLVQSGKFSPRTKKIQTTDPPLPFAELFYESLDETSIIDWATSPNSFVIVAMVERGEGFRYQKELRAVLSGKEGAKKVKRAAGVDALGGTTEKKNKKNKKGEKIDAASEDEKMRGSGNGNAGAKILVKLLDL